MRYLLLATILVAGCGSDPGVPSCSQAMGSYYANGCAIFSDSGALTLSSAVTGCNQLVVEANAIGGSCPSRMDSFLRCLDGVSGSSQCEKCNSSLGSLMACN